MLPSSRKIPGIVFPYCLVLKAYVVRPFRFVGQHRREREWRSTSLLAIFVSSLRRYIVASCSYSDYHSHYLAPLTSEEVYEIDNAGAMPWHKPGTKVEAVAFTSISSEKQDSETIPDTESQRLGLESDTRAKMSVVRRAAFVGLAAVASLVVLSIRHCYMFSSAM